MTPGTRTAGFRILVRPYSRHILVESHGPIVAGKAEIQGGTPQNSNPHNLVTPLVGRLKFFLERDIDGIHNWLKSCRDRIKTDDSVEVQKSGPGPAGTPVKGTRLYYSRSRDRNSLTLCVCGVGIGKVTLTRTSTLVS